MAYAKVEINNCTDYRALGQVNYSSAFCSNDKYQVENQGTWRASSRGACLVTSITATLSNGDKTIDVETYKSSGTSYHQFAIMKMPNGKYVVTRVTNGEGDEPPLDYIAPTEDQKTTFE